MKAPRQVSAWLRRVMAEPGTAGLDLDDAGTTASRRRLVQSKPFLKRIYDDWYQRVAAADARQAEPMLEIGSGAGHLYTVVQNLITSDVLAVSGVNVVLDGCRLPFADRALRGVAMTNVMHHLPDPEGFFNEASRCLVAGGTIVMIEPWVTAWSRLIYGSLHHEPFDPEAAEWTIAAGNPLSEANGALPWIVFQRDRSHFSANHPELQLVSIKPLMSFVYLFSGGMSMRAVMPGWTFGFWRRLDDAITRLLPGVAMFAVIVLRKELPKRS